MSISQEQLDASQRKLDEAMVAWLDTLNGTIEAFNSAYEIAFDTAKEHSALLKQAAKSAPHEVSEDYTRSAQQLARSINFAMDSFEAYRLDKGFPTDNFGIRFEIW